MLTIAKRRDDWPQELERCIERARRAVFAWGSHDCCLFAADITKALTGVDPAESFRGKYTDERGAAVLIAEHVTLQALVESLVGPPLHPSQARRGDPVMVSIKTPAGQRDALGIRVGRYCAVPQIPAGLAFVPMKDWRCAWRIG